MLVVKHKSKRMSLSRVAVGRHQFGYAFLGLCNSLLVIIYYGSMADKYIIMLQILDTKKEQDMDVATRVSVQLQLTDPDLKSRDRVVKKSEKDSLYAAMDVGSIWLERALAGK